MKRERITQQRAWTHVATSPLARVAVALLLLLSGAIIAVAAMTGSIIARRYVRPLGTVAEKIRL